MADHGPRVDQERPSQQPREIARQLLLVILDRQVDAHVAAPDGDEVEVVPIVLHVPYAVGVAELVFVHVVGLDIGEEGVVLLRGNSPRSPGAAEGVVGGVGDGSLLKVLRT